MPDIDPKWFHGVDLGYYGLVTKGVEGIHDLPDEEVARTFVEGSAVPHEVKLRDSLVNITFECVLAEVDHAALVAKMKLLRGFMSPTLGRGPLIVPDRPTERTFAKSLGFGFKMPQLPYLDRTAEWTWRLERLPWWEDLHERTVTVVSAGTVTNSGDMAAYPTYVCTATDALPDGLTFTVGAHTFIYSGALVLSDVLVVETEIPDVLLNDSRAWGNADPTSQFPTLAVGANAITTSSANFSLDVVFRRRFI